MPVMGFLNSIKTIMMLNICSVLPDMYIIIAFMGSALAGARASSHDFFSLSVSVSAVVGGFRVAFLDGVVVVRCDIVIQKYEEELNRVQEWVVLYRCWLRCSLGGFLCWYFSFWAWEESGVLWPIGEVVEDVIVLLAA